MVVPTKYQGVGNIGFCDQVGHSDNWRCDVVADAALPPWAAGRPAGLPSMYQGVGNLLVSVTRSLCDNWQGGRRHVP